VYDSQVGICCHFCRQKKLCGEPNCPRCEKRSTSEECIGKTECSRCHSATGKFCRACLLIRYGEGALFFPIQPRLRRNNPPLLLIDPKVAHK